MRRRLARTTRMSYVSTVIRIVFLCWPFSIALAQYHFDVWTTDNGLPLNSTSAILQTTDGYLWLTTSDGLVRFDGVRFTVFNKNNSPGMSGNYLTSLYEDRNGALWIGSDDNTVMRFSQGNFSNYSVQGAPSGGWVQSISGDESGKIWVLLNTRVVRWADKQFLPIETKGFPNDNWAPVPVIQWENRGGFWTQSLTGLTTFVQGHVRSWTRQDGLPDQVIEKVAQDEHGVIWVAMSHALLAIHDGRLTQVRRSTGCLPNSETNFVSSPKLKLVCLSGQRTLSLINLDSWDRRNVGPLPADFPTDVTGSVFYQDREGNLWIKTRNQGLYRARKELITAYSQPQGLRDRNIYPILEDNSGAIWIGGWPGSLTRFKNGTFTNYTRKNGLNGKEISALYQDHSGRLWVGAYGYNRDGLRVLQNGRFVAPSELRNLGVVKAILQDHRGALWFGTEDRLVRYDPGNSTTYTTTDGLASTNITVLIEGAAGELWIGGYGGLTRFRNGKFIAYTERDGLPSNRIRALYEDSDGVLWIGTHDGGLGRFKDGKFTRYTTREGLFNNGVFQILEDSRGNLWMSSNHGIYRVSKRELNEFAAGRRTSITSISYGKSDGMLNVECNGGYWPAGIKARDGKLWFPTQDGVAVIDPEDVVTNSLAPPVVIESALVDHTAVDIKNGVRAKPEDDNFEIQYTALSLINSERIRFKYKLEGLDRAWVNAGSRRTAYYSHVQPGIYRFRVIAANSDGVWNTEGSTLPVVVLGPFYRKWWFATLALMCAIGVVALAWRHRVGQLKRAQAAQLEFSRRLIISQESERKRIASELHDSLGQSLAIIKTRALLSLNQPEDHRRAMEHLDEIAQGASHTIDEVKEIAYNLRPYHLERLGLRKSIEAMLKRISSTGEVRFGAEMDDVDGLLSPDEQINVYRIVQESASNILEHAKATEAKVTIRRAAAGLEILVQDDGIGFSPDQVNLNQAVVRGFGLIGIAERARILGGNLTIDSAPGKGTLLKVEVALGGRRNGK